ncbi:hypothetical protein ACHAWF_003695, partial [Thalassiosira exigua]
MAGGAGGGGLERYGFGGGQARGSSLAAAPVGDEAASVTAEASTDEGIVGSNGDGTTSEMQREDGEWV